METQTSAEKTGEDFARLPRFRLQGLVNRTGSHLASKFGKSKPFPDHLRNGEIEAVSIVHVFAVIEAEHLLIHIAEQMKRFHSNVSTMQPALQQTPEVFESVRVDATANVLFCVIDHVMSVNVRQFVVGDRIVAIELRPKLNLIQNRVLQGLALHVRYNGCTNLAFVAVEDSMHRSFSEMLESLRVN